ncbi:MAG TPA: GNAT family N-acetyltransferase [Vicinamibacterales bacterium]|nr:GNAT family N-acetyltransferase [Vicinamibacterales bacterium]
MLQSSSINPGRIELRPAGPADAAHIQALVRGLTPRTRYLRFFNGVQELALPWLQRFSRAEPHGAFTLLATVPQSEAVIGMAHYFADPYPERADFAIVVEDAWQGHGVGRRLVCRLIQIARASGLQRLEAEVLSENRRALEFVERLGFESRRDAASALLVHASLALRSKAPDYSCNAGAVG